VSAGPRTLRTAVGIVGAGPAGLMIANLLQGRGIETVVIDKFSREQVHARARAGFIEWRNRVLLEEFGLATRMLAEGSGHGRCEFRSHGHSFVLDYAALAGGRVHWVYPQQELVEDMATAYVAGGGDLRSGLECTAVLDHEAPAILCRDSSGEDLRIECEVLAGCDGFHGPVRASFPPGALQAHSLGHPFTWLTLLAAAPPSSEHIVYAQHSGGYAAHMMRSAQVSRYYLQCGMGDRAEDWSDERIWEGLRTRLGAPGFRLVEGPLLERAIVTLRCEVFEPLQYRRVLLAGDAAHIITPCGGKGMNLALQDAVVFADVAERHLAGEAGALASYSARRLPDIWRAQEFSHWMLHMLHNYEPGPESAFQQQLQRSRLHSLEHDREFATHFAHAYVGAE
jgi:p-hydroxybenzoate 3-monooxygenase